MLTLNIYRILMIKNILLNPGQLVTDINLSINYLRYVHIQQIQYKLMW